LDRLARSLSLVLGVVRVVGSFCVDLRHDPLRALSRLLPLPFNGSWSVSTASPSSSESESESGFFTSLSSTEHRLDIMLDWAVEV
jgi:hypothetical protein